MAYINITTNEYPLYEGDIRLAHPEIGEDFILPSEYATVELEPVPECDKDYYPVAEPLIKIGDKYVQTFRAEKMSDEDIYQRDSKPTNVPQEYYWNQFDKVWVEANPLPTE
jgi:hypothetical protein